MEPLQPTFNKYILLSISVITSFLNPFMAASVNVALPKIGLEFAMNAVAMSWIAMAFLLSSAVALLPAGKMADIIGRKRVFIYGNIIVGIASLICALSVSGTMLIAARLLQGFGAALIFGTGMAIVTSAFSPKERGRIIGINVTAVYLGLSLAPVLGGFLTQTIGWRSLFFLTIPISLFATLSMYYFVKAEWKGSQHETFDLRGSVGYMLAMSALMFGFSKIPDTLGIVIAFAGLGGLIAFVKLQQLTLYPLINIHLFKNNRIFAFSNLAALINYAATFAISFVLSLYLQYVKGLSPSDAGLLLITQPLVMALFASVSGRLSDKYDSRILSSIGMAIIVIGLIMLVAISASTETPYLIACLIVLGAGFGLFSSPNTNSVMSSVEIKYLGVASAAISTMRVTGQMFSMGIATLIIHVFIGEAKISSVNITSFIGSIKAIFFVFSVLCAAGIFASLARGNKA